LIVTSHKVLNYICNHPIQIFATQDNLTQTHSQITTIPTTKVINKPSKQTLNNLTSNKSTTVIKISSYRHLKPTAGIQILRALGSRYRLTRGTNRSHPPGITSLVRGMQLETNSAMVKV